MSELNTLKEISELCPHGDLPSSSLQTLALAFRPVLFPPGAVLLEQGKTVTQVGLIASGSARWDVPLQNTVLSGTMRQGDWFGLVEVLSERPSITILRCIEPVTCYIQKSEEFRLMLRYHQELREFFYRLAFVCIKEVWGGMGSSQPTRLVSITHHHWKIPRNVEKSILYMEQNYTQPITLEDVAKANGMSKYHFSRVFKSETSLTFSEYLNKRRIEAAKALMSEQRMNVSEASFAVGFNDVSYFSRIFRKLTGMAPSSYIRSARESTSMPDETQNPTILQA